MVIWYVIVVSLVGIVMVSDVPTDTDRWVSAQMLAWYMIEENMYRGLTEGATHYHADYVNPEWNRDLQLVGRIGEHIFYRWE
jgi:Cell wall hydrolyses involved in spore germination